MQRRIQQSDHHRQLVHLAEDAGEVANLEWQQRVECLLHLRVTVGEDQVFDEFAAIAEEHVLGARETDAFRAHSTRACRVVLRVGIRPDSHAPDVVRVLDEDVHGSDERIGLDLRVGQCAIEVAGDVRIGDGHIAVKDLTGGAVDADGLAFCNDLATGGGEPIGFDEEFVCTADRGLPHAACDDCRVRCLATTRGEDAECAEPRHVGPSEFRFHRTARRGHECCGRWV